MATYYLIPFLVMVRIGACREEFIQTANFDTFHCISGSRFDSGTIIKTIQGEDILKCVRQCLENQCSLVNWFDTSSKCELRALTDTYTMETQLCGMTLTSDATATVYLNVSMSKCNGLPSTAGKHYPAYMHVFRGFLVMK